MNIVLFDGVCNLCNSTVLFLIKHDTNNNLHFAAQQSDVGIRIMNEHGLTTSQDASTEYSSVILIKDGQLFYKSNAVIEIGRLLTGWPRIVIAGSVLPSWFRDLLYAFIAKYRYRLFGKRKQCMMPSESIQQKFLL